MRKCQLCATPGVQIKDGHQICAGCGKVCLYDLHLYLQRDHTRVTFDRATRKYENEKPCESFGSWLLYHNYELIGKP